MRTKIFVRTALIVSALVFVPADLARADKPDLQARLSKSVKIELNDVTIAEALDKIGKKAGVKLVLSNEAAWKLPYGEATRLSVALDGPLAESLAEMLNIFFMRYVVGDGEITIHPRQELEHILGRPTAKQLELLRRIYTRPIRRYIHGAPERTINIVLDQEILISPIKKSSYFSTILSELRLDSVEPQAGEQFELATAITLVQLLAQVGPRWYISEMDFPNQIPEIRIVSTNEFLEAKLNQVVDISFHDERADTIIQRLANWTGMELFISKRETSWLEETITVEMQNVKLRQAIRNVVSTVDGGISIYNDRKKGIYVDGPVHSRIPSSARRGTRPTKVKASEAGGGDYVGKISIPMDGGKYFIEFMLRERDLTDELKALRAEKMKAMGLKEREKLHPAAVD